jgi:hypothetical protein
VRGMKTGESTRVAVSREGSGAGERRLVGVSGVKERVSRRGPLVVLRVRVYGAREYK